MLRKLVVTSIAFAAGYYFGAVSGFRAAVVDYVENDSTRIEHMADEMYNTEGDESDGEELPSIIEDAINETSDDDDGESTGPVAFQ